MILSNTQIIPSMIFKALGDISRYIQRYYLHSSTQMFLDIQPTFNLKQKDYLLGLNDSLITTILHQFTSQILWDRSLNHAIHTKCFYARHITTDEFLFELAYIFEEGVSPTNALDTSQVFHNLAYAAKRKSLFFAPCCKGSLF